jgi:tetratricopeptide (TPR) repeat protein
VISSEGDFTQAYALLEEGLVLSRQEGYKESIAYSLYVLGTVAILQRDIPKAQSVLKESLALFKEVGDRQNIAQSLGGLAWVSLIQGDYDAARSLLEESLAFRDAELLTEAIDAGFSGEHPLSEALSDYERRRNEHVLPMYEFTCQLASFEPPSPEMQQLFAALCGNQVETNRLLGTVVGTVPIPEFFSLQNIERIVTGRNLLSPGQTDRGGDARSPLPHAA